MKIKRIALSLLCVVVALITLTPAIALAGINIGLESQTTAFYDLNTYTTANDGNLFKTSTVYNTAWTAASADAAVLTSTVIEIGQSKSGSDYGLSRGALFFDTSSIADTDVVTSATIYVYGKYDWSDTDFDITVQNGQPTYPHIPMVVNDYSKTYYAGDGGTLNTSSFTTSGYNAISLNATGLTWISLTGTTKLVLRSSREIAGTTPSGQEEIFIYSSEETGTSKDPYIVIETASAPAATTKAASDVAQTTARLNSTIDDDGGDLCRIRFGYGETTQAAIGDYDSQTAWTDYLYSTSNNPYIDVDSLSDDTLYYFRVEVENAHSAVTSVTELSFTTESAVGNTTNFTGIPSEDSNSLSWTRGVGASNVMIRYRTDTYPTAVGDGTLVYLGSLSTYEHTGLLSGKTYFYSAWGESGGSYSGSEINLALTTLGADPSVISSGAADLPDQFLQDVDAGGLAGLSPYPEILASFAAEIGMPEDNLWFGIAALIILVLAGIVLFTTHSLIATSITMLILMIVAAGMKLMPGWMLFVGAIFVLGSWVLGRYSPNN